MSVIVIRVAPGDAGRLIGKGGATHAALRTIARELYRNDKLDVEIPEPEESDKLRKLDIAWDSGEVLGLLERILTHIHGKQTFTMGSTETNQSIMIEVRLSPSAKVGIAEQGQINDAMSVLFHAMGRNSGLVVKLWMH